MGNHQYWIKCNTITFSQVIAESNSMSKLIHERTVINNLTGEISKSDTFIETTTSIGREPAYIKMYFADLALWHGLSKSESDVLHAITGTVDYDGILQITSFMKAKIIGRLGIAPSTFANCLAKLLDKQIILRIPNARQVFNLNPFLFGRGDWKDILEQRKAFCVQITKTYGMPAPDSKNLMTFSSFKKSVEKTEQEQLEARGQQRLVE